MKTTNRVAVKIDDMQKAIKLYEMAATADGVVSVEQASGDLLFSRRLDSSACALTIRMACWKSFPRIRLL